MGGRIKIQSDLEKLDNWSEVTWMKFKEDKCKVLQPGAKNPMHSYKVGII